MVKISFITTYLNVFSILVLIAIYHHLLGLHYSVTYEQSQVIWPAGNISTTIQICYKLALHKDTCRPTFEKLNQPKESFSCNFKKPIQCYAKDFSDKSPSFIIRRFKKCKIENFTSVTSESNLTVRSEVNEYELFMDHICVNYRFKVQPEEMISKIKIRPVGDNKQAFYILIQGKRAFKNQSVHWSKKQNLIKRSCWLSSSKSDNYSYDCTEDNKEIDLQLRYFSQLHLQWPYDSNCVRRGGIDQHACYENCIKKQANYNQLTYSEKDDKSLANKKQIPKKLLEKCVSLCDQPDCVTGTFILSNINQKNTTKNGFITMIIDNRDKPTEARPEIKLTSLFYVAVVYFFLFFGLNLSKLLFCVMNLHESAKPSKKRKLMSKRVLKSVAIFVIGLVLAVIFEMKFFHFGIKKEMVTSRIHPVKERNISISICYDLCSILKDRLDSVFKKNCSEKNLMHYSIRELDEITWSVEDFKMVSSMRNSVKIVPIRQADYIIRVFFRGFKKCFLLFYEGKNLFPPISLQHKSMLHLNSSDGKFSHFYIEEDLKYPQIDAPKSKTSRAHIIEISNHRGSNCTDYSATYRNCSSKDDCIQACILKEIYERRHGVPFFINLKLDDTTKNYLNFKFDHNYSLFELVRDVCERDRYPERECRSAKTRLAKNGLFSDPHHITVTLTPKLIFMQKASDENRLLVMNRLVSFFIILTGISIKGVVNGFIAIYFSPSAFLCGKTFINRAIYLMIFLLFSIHFTILFFSIVWHTMRNQFYATISEEIMLPKIRACYEISTDLSKGNQTKEFLDANTLNVTEFLLSVTLLDRDYQKHIIKANETWPNSSLFTLTDFYVDNFKCFNFGFKINYKTMNTNILKSSKLLTLVFDLVKVPKRRIFIHLNSNNTLDFELPKPLTFHYHNIIFVTEDFMFQDDFWIFKNLLAYVKSLFGLETLKNSYKLYYKHLQDSFSKQQFVATTVIPLGKRAVPDAIIRNQQFNNYIHFRSLLGNRDDFDFHTNIRNYFFLREFISEKNYLSENLLAISLGSIQVKLKIIRKNYYLYVEFFLHLLIVLSFWFRLDFINLPISLRKAYPIFKYFLIVLLYHIVVFLLSIFEIWFKLIKFLDFK